MKHIFLYQTIFFHIFDCYIGYFSFISYCFSPLLYEYCFILHIFSV